MKSYTDIEQSKKLSEILSLESADYFHVPDAGIVVTEPYKLNIDDETVITAYKGAIPCWSLAALLDFLPNSAFLERGSVTELYRITLPIELVPFDWFVEPVDACYEMIICLNELKML